ncbi:MAG TPA: c-type cytochrome [Terriglobales bacterium]|nr:c-type cytochrome [Terriglobales bacterium]
MRVMAMIAAMALLLFAACERERRDFRTPTSAASPGDTGVEQSPLHPGGGPPLKPGESESEANGGAGPYEYNAYAVAEGQKLYMAFNCVGCHFHGGGGIGSPLMDANWIYGSQPQNIHDTIVEGRPNGMPSFRGRIPDYQVWQIVAYVRSMSGQLPPTVRPGRSDNMNIKKPEQVIPSEHPQQR